MNREFMYMCEDEYVVTDHNSHIDKRNISGDVKKVLTTENNIEKVEDVIELLNILISDTEREKKLFQKIVDYIPRITLLIVSISLLLGFASLAFVIFIFSFIAIMGFEKAKKMSYEDIQNLILQLSKVSKIKEEELNKKRQAELAESVSLKRTLIGKAIALENDYEFEQRLINQVDISAKEELEECVKRKVLKKGNSQ